MIEKYLYSPSGKILMSGHKYRIVPLAWYTVTDSDFSTNYSTRLAGLTATEPNIKIPSHVKSGSITNQLWDCSNSNTVYITFTDEDDFALNRFDVANADTTKQGALKEISNLPDSVRTMSVSAPNIKKISNVGNLTSFTFKYNTAMTNLDGIVGLSDNENITSLKLQENTGLVDLGDFIIPENVTELRAMFQGCSSLSRVRIDYNYTSSIWSSSGLMFQRTAIKHLDIYATDVQSNTMFAGYSPSSVVEIRCLPNTNTWTFWKSDLEANTSSIDRTKYLLHSFDANPKSINIWGDSLTQGGDGTTYSDLCVKLSSMLVNDAVVHNCGLGGSSAATRASLFSEYDIGWDDITVLFFGHNSPYTTIQTYNESYIPHLSKYIVLGLVTKNYSTSMNNQMAEEYGNHFLDTHAYMVANGFAITGLTPTAQDEEDLANGNVPHSFLASDYIHINGYGGLIVATAIKEKLLSLGYINNTWLAS